MDVESGSVHVVDDMVYDMIAALDEYSANNTIRTVIDEDDIKAAPFSEVREVLLEKLSSYIFPSVKTFTVRYSERAFTTEAPTP